MNKAIYFCMGCATMTLVVAYAFFVVVYIQGVTISDTTYVEPPNKVVNPVIIDPEPTPVVTGLPEGYRIVRNTSDGMYRFTVPPHNTMSGDYDTYNKALAGAIGFAVYSKREENSKWIDVDESMGDRGL